MRNLIVSIYLLSLFDFVEYEIIETNEIYSFYVLQLMGCGVHGPLGRLVVGLADMV